MNRKPARNQTNMRDKSEGSEGEKIQQKAIGDLNKYWNRRLLNFKSIPNKQTCRDAAVWQVSGSINLRRIGNPLNNPVSCPCFMFVNTGHEITAVFQYCWSIVWKTIPFSFTTSTKVEYCWCRCQLNLSSPCSQTLCTVISVYVYMWNDVCLHEVVRDGEYELDWSGGVIVANMMLQNMCMQQFLFALFRHS